MNISRIFNHLRQLFLFLLCKAKKCISHILRILRFYFPLLLTSFVIAIYAFCCLWLSSHGKPVDWSSLVVLCTLSLVWLYISYKTYIIAFLKLNTASMEKFDLAVIPIVIVVITFWLGTFFAGDFFTPHRNIFNNAFCVLFIIISFIVSFWHCCELCRLKGNHCSHIKKTILFVLCIVQIIQFFALSYILLICVDKDPFTNLTFSTAIELCFEMTYYSAMTLLSGPCDIIAKSMLAKIITTIETFIFTVFISYIAFGEFSYKPNKSSKAN